MKKVYLLLSILFIESMCVAQAPNTWTRKADFPGQRRSGAVGFSIGTKGYIGTGENSSNQRLKDFWEWDQATNIWTQKADFGGINRSFATGFSIGTKGYIGTGTPMVSPDFWEWNQASNAWTQIAPFSGPNRAFAIGFSIGTKGYVGTGWAGNIYKDFWEWNQATNSWTQKADFGGLEREEAVGFSIGTKGYIGTGAVGTNFYNDFWEWDQATNVWTQKADFAGGARYAATGFSIGSKGYIGLGYGSGTMIDFWEWDQATNIWVRKANFPVYPQLFATGLSIGNKGYISALLSNDFWEYTPDSGYVIATGDFSTPSFCRDADLNVAYVAYTTFNPGNVFNAQLSDASGSFANPRNIGYLSSTTSGVIKAIIPSITTGSGYRIRVVSTNPVVTGSDNGSNISIIPNAVLNLKCYIQGYYVNGGSMRKVLYNEKVEANSASTNVDTVIVRLYITSPPYAVYDSYKGVLQTNGTLACKFLCIFVGNPFYISVTHRNGVQTWSAAPVALSSITSYDFTTAANKAYSGNMIQMEPGKWAFYNGDINQDENIDILDFPPLEYGIVSGLTGYYASDLNGDGNVDLLDFAILNANIYSGVVSMHPR